MSWADTDYLFVREKGLHIHLNTPMLLFKELSVEARQEPIWENMITARSYEHVQGEPIETMSKTFALAMNANG
jgi:hypothetical protein